MVSLFLVICMTDNNGLVIFVIWIVASSLHSISPGASITMLTLLLLANFLLPAQPKVWPAFPFRSLRRSRKSRRLWRSR